MTVLEPTLGGNPRPADRLPAIVTGPLLISSGHLRITARGDIYLYANLRVVLILRIIIE
jgi:hypothetical protein